VNKCEPLVIPPCDVLNSFSAGPSRQEHGYASDGESFSCVDGKEAWLMELIGKGKFEKGAVWVAGAYSHSLFSST